MKKKLLSLLLVLAMCLMLLPVAAFATIDDVEYYGLLINGVDVTSANKDDLSVIDGVTGTVKYDPQTNTLSLKNATIVQPRPTVMPTGFDGEATRGQIYIRAYAAIEYMGAYSQVLRSVSAPSALTIVSEGTNTVSADAEYGGVGIEAASLVFDLRSGSSLNVTGGQGPAIVAFGGPMILDSATGYMPDAVYIEGPGALKAEAPDNDYMAVAVVANGNFIIDGASVTLTAGEVEYDGTGYLDGMGESFLPPYSSVALFAQGDVGVIGGSLNATAKGGAMAVAVYGCGAIDIIDSVVTATAGESAGMGSGAIVCVGRGEMIIDDEPNAIEPEYGTGIRISGANTVVTARGETDAVWSSGGIVIEPPLEIVVPKGGEVYGPGIIDPDAAVPAPQPTGEPEFDFANATYVVISAAEPEPFVPGYWINMPKEITNGEARASAQAAGEGAEITITLKPDEGYISTPLEITDDARRPVEFTDNEDGTYTFVMPASDVWVKFRFYRDLPFEDLDPDDYYYDAVAYLYDNGITNGTSDTTFDPDGICDRAQTVTFLWRTLGEPEPTTTECAFTDIDPDAYYYKAVLWAAENGVTLGTSETTFEPELKVQRAMTVAFLYRTLKLQGKGFEGAWAFELDFTDKDDVPEWSYESFCWMVMNEIVQGTDAGELLPLEPCTRGQIAAMLYRTLA